RRMGRAIARSPRSLPCATNRRRRYPSPELVANLGYVLTKLHPRDRDCEFIRGGRAMRLDPLGPRGLSTIPPDLFKDPIGSLVQSGLFRRRSIIRHLPVGGPDPKGMSAVSVLVP